MFSVNFFSQWVLFWSYQLNYTANSAYLAHFCGKWAGLAVLFYRQLQCSQLNIFFFQFVKVQKLFHSVVRIHFNREIHTSYYVLCNEAVKQLDTFTNFHYDNVCNQELKYFLLLKLSLYFLISYIFKNITKSG